MLMKYYNIFDTHTHYNDARFADDMETVLTSLPEAGIFRIVNCGTTVASSAVCQNMAHEHEYIFFAAGIHGLDVKSAEIGDTERLTEFFKDEKCVAIGEIGLDYHYEAESRPLQLTYFEEQLALALEYDLPVIVHDREAHKDTLELLKKYRPKGILHCFSGSIETMREVLDLGLYIGLGGAVTFKNAKKPVEATKFVPIDRLVLETDCPYMTPVPFRGERNDSSKIPYIAQFIASLREMDTQDLINRTTENAMKIFPKCK